jgi:ankyrin repeat protein
VPYKEKYPLHYAVKGGQLEDVRDLLEKSEVAVDAKDSTGFTPFEFACQAENIG